MAFAANTAQFVCRRAIAKRNVFLFGLNIRSLVIWHSYYLASLSIAFAIRFKGDLSGSKNCPQSVRPTHCNHNAFAKRKAIHLASSVLII